MNCPKCGEYMDAGKALKGEYASNLVPGAALTRQGVFRSSALLGELEAVLRDAEKATANALVSEDFDTWTNAGKDEYAIRRTLQIMRSRSPSDELAHDDEQSVRRYKP